MSSPPDGAAARRRVARPSGAAPPETASGLELRPMAERVVDRYAGEFPDEDERYEPDVWRAWCRHDAQYLLQWGLLDADGAVVARDQVAWLAGILRARDFPLDRLARTLELCADELEAVGRADAAAGLRDATAEAA